MAKVIKFKTENESAVLLINLNQILESVVAEHGAHSTLDAVQKMIQDIQKRRRKNVKKAV